MPSPRLILVVASLCLSAVIALRPALADQVILEPIRDNTLYEDPAGALSNGAGPNVFAGNTASGVRHRALLAFDIAGNIPFGAIIDSVSLTLTCSKAAFGGPVAQDLHPVLTAWGESGSVASGQGGQGGSAVAGDATWLHTFHDAQFWSTPGGDHDSTSSASLTINGPGPYVWTSTALAADVQAWLDLPGTNHGWLLRGTEVGNSRARRFYSREHGTPGQRPQLVVNYTAQALVGACCFGDSCDVLTEADCLNQGGAYAGDGTTCSPNPCFVPTGACCFDDGTCADTTEAACLTLNGTYQGDGSLCTASVCPITLTPFLDPLPIPSIAVPTTGASGGTATYDIAVTQFQQQLHSELPPTTVWGYDGTFPGPTIEAFRDQPIQVTWINDLRDTSGAFLTEHPLPVDLCLHGPNLHGSAPRTVVHLHGGHTEAASDGFPEDTILPGQSQVYTYSNKQLPAGLWYHDHAMGITAINVYMGLAGFYLIRDDDELDLDLPDAGYEIPLVIQDRTFNADGSLHYPSPWQEHFFGDKVLVNGKVWPYLDVDQGRYRFRMLNGSNSRTYRLSLSTGDSFQVIGSDGGLLPAPVTVTELVLAPAERADVIIDFSGYAPGTDLVLVNDAPAPFMAAPGVGVIPDVMQFRVQVPRGVDDPLPAALRPFEALPESTALLTRDFILAKESDPCTGSIWKMNGLGWMDVTEYPVLGTTEIWRFINDSGMVHPMHMHLVMFEVLDSTPFTMSGDSVIATGPPVPPDSVHAGWKDTIPVYPGQMVRVIARFEDYTGQYVYHCHILEHEDNEMMREFVVVDTLRVFPPDTLTVPGGSLTLTASGGRPPYEFSFVTNASGGTLDPSTGLFTAGDTSGVTDTVRVEDVDGWSALAVIDVNAIVGAGDGSLPAVTRILALAPNPARAMTEVSYALASPGRARVQVFGLNGGLVTTLVDDPRPAGIHRVFWNGRADTGREVASGIYLIRLVSGERVDTQRLVRLR